MRVNNDAFSTVWHDSHVTFGHDEGGKAGDSLVQLLRDHHLKIYHNTAAHVGGDVAVLVGAVGGPGRVDLHVRSYKLELIDGNRHEHTIKDMLEKVNGSVSRVVGRDEHVKIGGAMAVETGAEVHSKSSKIVLDSGSELTIQAPAATSPSTRAASTSPA